MMLILLLACIFTSFADAENNDLKTIRREFADFRIKVNEQFDVQTSINKKLNDVIKDQELRIQAQEQVIKELKARCTHYNNLPREVKTHERSLIPRQSTGNIAFFATMSTSYQDHVGLHQNIIFEDVKTNIGNAYNNHHGVFTAPVSGLYLITATLLSRQNMEFWAAIVVNGNEVAHLNERGTDGRHGSSSQSVTIQLKRGDDVAVQNILVPYENYWGDRYSSFGGFLITEM